MSAPNHHEQPDASDRALWTLLEEERHRERVAERQQRFWLERQAQESTELIDLIGDVARRGGRVRLRTTTGTLDASTLTEVGADYVAVALAPGAIRLVPISTIVSVRARHGAPAFGWPSSTRAGSLADRLREAVGQHPHVTASSASETTTGVLRSVGRDVLVLDEPDGGVAYLGLASLDDVVLR